jgi:hypothetical protein
MNLRMIQRQLPMHMIPVQWDKTEISHQYMHSCVCLRLGRRIIISIVQEHVSVE